MFLENGYSLQAVKWTPSRQFHTPKPATQEEDRWFVILPLFGLASSKAVPLLSDWLNIPAISV